MRLATAYLGVLTGLLGSTGRKLSAPPAAPSGSLWLSVLVHLRSRPGSTCRTGRLRSRPGDSCGLLAFGPGWTPQFRCPPPTTRDLGSRPVPDRCDDMWNVPRTQWERGKEKPQRRDVQSWAGEVGPWSVWEGQARVCLSVLPSSTSAGDRAPGGLQPGACRSALGLPAPRKGGAHFLQLYSAALREPVHRPRGHYGSSAARGAVLVPPWRSPQRDPDPRVATGRLGPLC